jgi:hypothetical protein
MAMDYQSKVPKARTMKTRSILNRVLSFVAVVLVAPLLAVATPTPSCGALSPTTPVTFPDHIYGPGQHTDATFSCSNVTFATDTILGSADVVTTLGSMFTISSDNGPSDTDVVFTGDFNGQPIQFVVSDGPGLNQETVSMTPEPGSILLFGTGLLIAGGFIRRRMLAQTLA